MKKRIIGILAIMGLLIGSMAAIDGNATYLAEFYKDTFDTDTNASYYESYIDGDAAWTWDTINKILSVVAGSDGGHEHQVYNTSAENMQYVLTHFNVTNASTTSTISAGIVISNDYNPSTTIQNWTTAVIERDNTYKKYDLVIKEDWYAGVETRVDNISMVKDTWYLLNVTIKSGNAINATLYNAAGDSEIATVEHTISEYTMADKKYAGLAFAGNSANNDKANFDNFTILNLQDTSFDIDVSNPADGSVVYSGNNSFCINVTVNGNNVNMTFAVSNCSNITNYVVKKTYTNKPTGQYCVNYTHPNKCWCNYSWKITINEYNNDTNNQTFYINYTFGNHAPSIKINSPNDGYETNKTTATLNITVSDKDDNSLNYVRIYTCTNLSKINPNKRKEWTTVNVTGSHNKTLTYSLSLGNITYWYVQAYDGCNSTVSRVYTIIYIADEEEEEEEEETPVPTPTEEDEYAVYKAVATFIFIVGGLIFMGDTKYGGYAKFALFIGIALLAYWYILPYFGVI